MRPRTRFLLASVANAATTANALRPVATKRPPLGAVVRHRAGAVGAAAPARRRPAGLRRPVRPRRRRPRVAGSGRRRSPTLASMAGLVQLHRVASRSGEVLEAALVEELGAGYRQAHLRAVRPKRRRAPHPPLAPVAPTSGVRTPLPRHAPTSPTASSVAATSSTCGAGPTCPATPRPRCCSRCTAAPGSPGARRARPSRSWPTWPSGAGCASPPTTASAPRRPGPTTSSTSSGRWPGSRRTSPSTAAIPTSSSSPAAPPAATCRSLAALTPEPRRLPARLRGRRHQRRRRRAVLRRVRLHEPPRHEPGRHRAVPRGSACSRPPWPTTVPAGSRRRRSATSSADAPPFFVLHGTNDSLVPVAQARTFVDELRKASTSPVVYGELPARPARLRGVPVGAHPPHGARRRALPRRGAQRARRPDAGRGGRPRSATAGLMLRRAGEGDRVPARHTSLPTTLPPRWAAVVADALDARRRWDDLLAGMRPGPLRDRLRSWAVRVDDGVLAVWETAVRAVEAGRIVEALDAETVTREYKRAKADPAADPALVEALSARFTSVQRVLEHDRRRRAAPAAPRRPPRRRRRPGRRGGAGGGRGRRRPRRRARGRRGGARALAPREVASSDASPDVSASRCAARARLASAAGASPEILSRSRRCPRGTTGACAACRREDPGASRRR